MFEYCGYSEYEPDDDPVIYEGERAWLCELLYEVEKPFTDSERGCEYYKPSDVIYSRTRGLARAEYWAYLKYHCGYDDVQFIDIRVRVYKEDAR